MFVTEKVLNKEKDHVEGFSPEVAWVTRAGDTDMKVPIAIRPTSETIMYPAYAKWIRGHRDLPIKLNQWTNIVRWEFKHPTPFLRTREFLWQEGHSAFATREEADEEVLQILNLYRRIYEDLLACPAVMGRKSEEEKFPGGEYTTTVEMFIPTNGRAIQGGTSHCLGQKFAKMFDIKFQDQHGKEQLVHQNSWGLTTRTLGVMIMTHGDNKGLVLPPRVARFQLVCVPIYSATNTQEEVDAECAKLHQIARDLEAVGVRSKVDDRTIYTPGWKYSHWELKGVPLRAELGPKDMANESVMLVRRDTNQKIPTKWTDLTTAVPALLEQIQADLLASAIQKRDAQMKEVHTWEKFTEALDAKCMTLVPWCEEEWVELMVKERTGPWGPLCNKVFAEHKITSTGQITEAVWKQVKEALDERKKHVSAEEQAEIDEASMGLTGAAKTLCLPFEDTIKAQRLPDVTKLTCFASGLPAKVWTLWGRSY